MKKIPFDCVDMKRIGAAAVIEKITSMTRDQELEYWRKRTREMLRAQKNKKRPEGEPNRSGKSNVKTKSESLESS